MKDCAEDREHGSTAEHLEQSTSPQADRYTKDTEMQGLNLWDAGQAT